jgi:UDP-N-acetyl-D-mannosaminuronate dehydrogenase
VVACDPHVPALLAPKLPCPLVPFDERELAGADVVVVLVDHPEFEPGRIAAASSLVFDAKGLLRGHEFRGETL